ncbi:protein VAC14 homolog isoform X2 [Agrilus planipennis]|uniref:Protein VAC14 homolog n=1 Tax=Agrilus planipennis TaxID=224129 RepID=A0A7F5R417_AGRPL|nr:protein VAC14 homolog isoform X2 [Agrilus planipennis]
MTDKDYAPLSAACVRALNDKIYEKRKTAALEIERTVKECAAADNSAKIVKIIQILGKDFANSQNPHTKKGGLIGLAAVAVALGKDTSLYIKDLVVPIVACFNDSDSRVRYYACESLYNVVKVARGAIIPHFTLVFSALSKIATDPEQSVKNASELLDRLMKDIVTENRSFDLENFMPLLRERIYSKHSFSRQFIISWISVLDAVPDIDLAMYLPEILDGLFRILDDPMLEVKKMCDSVLGEFLRSIKRDPTRVDFSNMVNILINHAQERNNDILQFTAITWIKEFVQLSGPTMLPFMSGILTAILPCLAYEADSRRNIKETATTVNHNLMKLVALQVEDEFNFPKKNSAELITNELDLASVVDVLTQHVLHHSVQTKVAVLRWIYHLFVKLPDKMFYYFDVIFPSLQKILSDPSDEVVQQCLVVIAEIISSPAREKKDSISRKSFGDLENANPYYLKFVTTLLESFNKDKCLLNDRGSFIIRQLCVLLNAEDIYCTLAKILLRETNLNFASVMVETLSMILLTSPELFELRNKLKDLEDELCYTFQESCLLFCCLYDTWCHNPVATVALCLLTQCYWHACELIKVLGCLEISVDFLTEIDKLVQLIESPIFAYLRLQLLEIPCDEDLIRALYGLLMLLPQTEAFHMLKTRLSCIPSLYLDYGKRKNSLEAKPLPKRFKTIDFKKLLNNFLLIQDKHRDVKKTTRIDEIVTLRKVTNNL